MWPSSSSAITTRMLRRPLLPEWRYWPATALALMIALAFYGAALPIPPQPIAAQNCAANGSAVCNTDPQNKRASDASFMGFIATYHNEIEAVAAAVGAVAGLALFVVTAGLWGSTGKLAIATDKLASGADAQTTEQRRANDIAEVGNEVALKALDEAVKEHKLNWHRWAAEQRPRLRIRLVRVLPLVAGNQVAIEFRVVNVGSSLATITSNELRLRIDGVRQGSGVQSLSWAGVMSLPATIREGESVLVTEESGITFQDWNFPGMGPWRIQGNIRIIGLITYNDASGTTRRTGFYRISTDDPNRFVRMGDRDIEADYEYED